MAYAAVTCLYHRINYLLRQTSVSASTQRILRFAGRSVIRLQRTLERYDLLKNNSQAVMAVDARIAEEACKLEDAIESQASAHFLSQSLHQDHGANGRLYLKLRHLRHQVRGFVETAKRLRAEYKEELYKPQEETAAAAAAAAAGGEDDDDCDMVGFPTHFVFRELLTANAPCVSSLHIVGMAGVGKTALAKKLFNDPLVKESFDCRAFVTAGQKYEFEDILGAIIAQLNVDEMMMEDEDETASMFLKRILGGRKFLIVVDDVWDQELDRDLTPLLPENCDGSFVFTTSRIEFTFTDEKYAAILFQMPLLSDEESWKLLQKKVFGGEDNCPPPLVKAGKKIAEKCEGLPLLIISVAKILSEAEVKTPEYWKEVAEMKNSVFEDAIDRIYEVLLRSYNFMVQNSKACFLYMAVFPHSYVVRRSRIVSLWRAEMFANESHNVFYYIIRSNLAVVREEGFSNGNAKAWSLHVVYIHLARREAENNKFLHVLTSYSPDEDISERMKGRRRLAIYHNTLLAIKEVHSSIDSSVSNLRSILCTGPYLQYQVPIFSELKLLRVLDAVSIRFYEFPVEVVRLIQLKYLSLTTNANLPPSINKLWFLEFLIVHQHSCIINHRSCVADSYVPVEIWDMKELEYLQIVGRNLPHPPPGVTLPNLWELLDVGVQTCTKEVLESVPKLYKLRIQIELAPDVDVHGCFDHVICLENLNSFRGVVMNPSHLPRPQSLSISSPCLRKLSLSGFGYGWEDMRIIAGLPNLKVLKLQLYAFRGEKWEAEGMRFCSLERLLVEDTDLVQWTASDETFPTLRYLTMKNCHKLKEIPPLETLVCIVLLDCNPLVETWAKVCGARLEVKYSWK